MSYFAILKSGDRAPPVTDCHINLWLFPEENGSKIYFDVGVAVSGGTLDAKFRIAVPFKAEACVPLQAQVREPAIAKLIFGEQVTGSAEYIQTVEIGRKERRQMYLPDFEHSRQPRFSTDVGEVWEISFTRPAPSNRIPRADAPTYLRFRFVPAKPEMLVQRSEGGDNS